MANEAPPFSTRFRRHLQPLEVQSVTAARGLDERLAALELDDLLGLLTKYGQLISQWPQVKHMPAFHEWVTTSPLDAVAKMKTMPGVR
jgi:hypothetical protein